MNIGIIVGHTKKDPGALAPGCLSSEYSYNYDLASLISCHAALRGHCALIIEKQNDEDAHELAIRVNSLNINCCVELHCNAFNGKVMGTEVLYCDTNRFNILFSTILNEDICELYDRSKKTYRGSKQVKRGQRGYNNIASIEKPCALIEPFFIDNPLDFENYGLKLKNKLAETIVLSCLNFNLYMEDVTWGLS